ncbi:vomeronasal type-2 receptor 26-like [Aquarana catesbeiana]|uniref:vomeronasal type-2 receptor 26-like n=1 Tax=Aquarana catesbeiana TaxID=8400 RepID=UPI003CC9E322
MAWVTNLTISELSGKPFQESEAWMNPLEGQLKYKGLFSSILRLNKLENLNLCTTCLYKPSTEGSDLLQTQQLTPSSVIPSPACHLQIVSAYEDYEYVQDGDIIIGGVFTVNCLMGGYKILEKPNVTDMLCLKKAIKSVLQILSGPGETIPNYSCRDHQKLAGFIGDQSSTTILPMAQILSVYHHVQISYGAVDDSFFDKDAFPSLYRTVEDDFMIYRYITEIIRHFGWTWVGIISSADESGERALFRLLRNLSSLQICVAFMIKSGIKLLMPEKSYFEGLCSTIEKLSVKVVILCGTYHDLIFESSLRRLLRNVTLILTPSWASHIALIEKFPDILNCSLSLNFWSQADKNFKNFVDSFHPMIHPEDKLLEDLWMTTLFCLSENKEKDSLYENLYHISLHNCTGQEHLPDFGDYSSDRTSDPVYHTVEFMVHVLQVLHSSQNYSCLKSQADDKEKYRHKLNWYLKTILYAKAATKKGNENLVIHFTIQNHVFVNGSLFTRSVGNFLSDGFGYWKLAINSTLINWKNKKNQVPKSQCSESCSRGYRKVPGFSIQYCCHSCVPCSYGEISNIIDSENCMKCPKHEWPNENRTRCIPKQVEFLSFTHDKISLVFITFSLLCFGKTVLVLVIFILHQDTPIVKANNKSLSFVLLVSIMLGFLCVFLFLGRPVDVTCLLRQISFGMLFTIAVSSVLAKTIMVCIAFKATKPNNMWKKWIGVKLPTCIVLACSSIQVIICISWLSISPPFQELDTHSYQEKIIIQCNEGSVIGFYSVLGYMGILAAVSFVIAFFARTLPDTFNEAKYITFSMLVFCSVWIAMIPAYLSTKGKYTVAVEIFAILISNNGLLYGIFLTKCFIILCRPELNTKGYLHTCQLQIIPAYEDYEYVQDGDIIIGGVFTVNCLMADYRSHEKPNVTSMFCVKYVT